VIGSKIYVVGGSDGTMNAIPTEIYDTTINVWSPAAPVGTNVGGGFTTAIGGRIYYAGGNEPFQGFSPAVSDRLRIYTPQTNTWTDGAPVPIARSFRAGGVINGKLYVAGGETMGGSGVTGELDIYDPATNTWTVGAALPVPRRSATGAVYGGKLYVFGGDPPGAPVSRVDVYNPVLDIWTVDTPMPEAFSHAEAVTRGSKIHILGGSREDGGPRASSNYVFDPVAHTWSVGLPMQRARASHAAAMVGNMIYAIGGEDGSFLLDHVEALESVNELTKDDCKKGGWATIGFPPGPFRNQGQCVSYFAHQ
jgi:N-acetylneuraminic acid mutarotase